MKAYNFIAGCSLASCLAFLIIGLATLFPVAPRSYDIFIFSIVFLSLSGIAFITFLIASIYGCRVRDREMAAYLAKTEEESEAYIKQVGIKNAMACYEN